MPQETETVYLAGLSDDEMNEVESLAKNVFEVQQAQLSASQHTLTLARAGIDAGCLQCHHAGACLTGAARCCSTCA